MINNYAEQDNSIANYYKLYNIPILNVSKKKKKKKKKNLVCGSI
jgi:hypothetical protein